MVNIFWKINNLVREQPYGICLKLEVSHVFKKTDLLKGQIQTKTPFHFNKSLWFMIKFKIASVYLKLCVYVSCSVVSDSVALWIVTSTKFKIVSVKLKN